MNQQNNDWLYSSEAFQSYFKTSPRSLLLKADAPHFTILAVSDVFLLNTGKKRSEVVNRPLFEVYCNGGASHSEKNILYNSLMKVIHTKETDALLPFYYELLNANIEKPERVRWSVTNEPLPGSDGNVGYIINATTNVYEEIITGQAVREALFTLGVSKDNEVLSDEQTQTNEELLASNKELSSAQILLKKMNEGLENRVAKRTQAFQESEARFRMIVEQAPVAIATFRGPQFVIDLCNDKALHYWGRTAEQVKGIPLFTALPETSRQGLEELLSKVLTTGKHVIVNELPIRIKRDKHLETAWVNFTYEPLRDETGDITDIIVVWTEVTEAVQARHNLEKIIEEKTSLENNLEESRQRLQGILDTMAEGVAITDANSKVVYANAMAQKILGLTENKIIERTYNDPKLQNLRLDGTLLPEEEHPMAIMMTTAMAVHDHEIGVKAPGREVFYISVNAAPILDAEGNVAGGIGTFMDVTNRRKLMEQKDEFISVASHELRTPLTALKASIQLLHGLTDDLTSPFLPRLIMQANTSVNKLNTLVNDLLDVEQISRWQITLRKTEFNVANMINDCCQHIRTAGTHTITFKGDMEKTTCADEQRINQVMVNFVNNAVKYAPDSNQIFITLEANEEEIKVSVKDFGTGIPKERIPFLFDRYYRADYTVGQGGGLGLGLYISSEIIKSHGGDLGVESEEGKGSTFWFTLPVLTNCR